MMSLLKRLIILVSFAGFVFVIPGLQAQETTDEKWTPALSMQYKSLSGTAISPDGNKIAYVVRKPIMEGEKSEYRSQIWVVSSNGKSNYQYTHGEKSATSPSFSPDGKYLSFTSSRGGKKNQVWIMRLQGGEAIKLTDAKSGVSSYRWSPDGQTIAYTMRDPESKEDEKRKKEKRDVILVDKNFKYNHLYTIAITKNDSDKHETKRLTNGNFHISTFDWSPDGSQIAFTHQPDPKINTGGIATDISVVPSDSGEVKPLVTREGADRTPRFSPDGKWIAFASHGGSPQRIGLSDIYLVPSSGGEIKNLGQTSNRNTSIISWSKDSKKVYVSDAIRTSRHIQALPVNGKMPKKVTKGEGIFSSISMSNNGKSMAFAYQNLETAVEIYYSSIDKFKKMKLTSINQEVAKPTMGKTEVLTWKSKDGMEIEGLLTYPVNYQAGRSYPLILNIHGGPAGVYSQSFTGNPSIYMLQYFAQQGFAIIRGNPRGSNGYGKDFRYANYKDWGFGDYEDIMAGVDKVIDMGVGHPDSLCVMGWSYGGYMTSYLVTKTDRFKAASMGAGLPNLISMVTTTDIPDYLVAHFGGEYWEDYETYEKHSAIYRIKNVKTPTQVIHGANDLRVPFTQGQEFYVSLLRLGVPTEMIVYPRTPHGPREPKFTMDVSQRIMKWFDFHLGRSSKKKNRGKSISDE